MREILAVSWEMPPLSGPRAVQVTRTLRELAILGWRARVICFGPRSTRYNQDYEVQLEAETDGAITRVKVPSPEEWFVFRALWRACPPLKLMPDEKRIWVGRALAAARRTLAAKPADLIVSFAQPWSDHLVGLRLHQETGLPWVAHFSDPWVDSPYVDAAGWQRRLSARMERDVVAHATRVVFVNQYTADRVMAKYPLEWRARTAVVPQGYDAHALPAPMPRTAPGNALRIVYTGRFYDALRTPDAFFRGLASLNGRTPLQGRVTVEIVGGAMQQYERLASRLGLGGIVMFAGRRSPAEALSIAASADVLLLIDAPSTGPNLYLPSKLVDYLPIHKPILALTPAEGASADLIGRLGYRTVDPLDDAGIANTIEQLLAQYESGALVPSPNHARVASAYDIRATTRALQAVFEDAVEAA